MIRHSRAAYQVAGKLLKGHRLLSMASTQDMTYLALTLVARLSTLPLQEKLEVLHMKDG